MDIKEFHALMMSAVARIPKFAPNFGLRDGTTALWFNEFKDVSPSRLSKAITDSARSMDEFPSMRQLLKLCGKEFLTEEQTAIQAAERVLQAANPNGGGRGREDLGELAFEVSQAIGGFWDLSEMRLNDASIYNTQRRKLTAIALAKIKRRALEVDATDLQNNSQIMNQSDIPNLNQAKESEQAIYKKTPCSPKLPDLIAGLKGSLGSMK